MDDLIEHILGGKVHLASYRLELWVKQSRRFEDFITRYKDKISKKFMGAKTDEDLNDVLAELFVSFLLLLNDRIEVEYEKLRVGNRRPDLSATFNNSLQFNIEVARVRRAEVDARFDDWHRKLVAGIRAGTSNLEFEIRLETSVVSLFFVDRLEHSIEDITQLVESTIEREQSRLQFGIERCYPIQGFEGVLTLALCKYAFAPEPGESAYNILSPIAYTQNEHYKFGDILVEKLGQLPPGMVNLIFITSDSNTHEPEDPAKGIESFFQALDHGDRGIIQKVLKKFKSIEDFQAKVRNLSGIVFRSKWDEHTDRNVLWCNAQASIPIPDELKEYIRHANNPSTHMS